ncbi:A/G-specific DNA-adenine glycosylase [Lachnospiraceae bacterium C10]|jgi:A/G-specific adenine glycosylase|nr:A/G-specific DNA-adenine glycosylase [Lachnospiraceae bacterium C10]
MKYSELPLDQMLRHLLGWYQQGHRDLPWRRSSDPYHIWISEIMLQQTRVEAVKRYYTRFLEALPTISSLATADEDQLMKLWEGLGYYSRARNLKAAAGVICEQYGGEMPKDYEKILSLPGIGAYTAGAVASIAYGLPYPAVDGNALRILGRAAECEDDILKEKTKREAAKALKPVIETISREYPKENIPGMINQAMMELGACVCIPTGEPLCGQCPWEEICSGRRHGTAMNYPVKKKAKKRRLEDKTVLVLLVEDKVLLHKREEKGLLSGLYELPNVEGHLETEQIRQLMEEWGLLPYSVSSLEDAKHIFSHIEWHMKGYALQVAVRDEEAFKRLGFFAAAFSQVKEQYSLPSAFGAYVKNLKELRTGR